MKFSILLAFAFLSLFATAQSDKVDRVNRELPVESFTSLTASGVYELRLVQGETESVTIDADEKLQAEFHIDSKGGKLSIDMKKIKNNRVHSKSKVIVTVRFKNLQQVAISTVGNTVGTDLRFGDLSLTTDGVGNVDLKLRAQKLSINNSGVGNVELSGTANSLLLNTSGVGNVRASDLAVSSANVFSSGVGNALVNVSGTLRVQKSGLGKVTNSGAAKQEKAVAI